MEVTKYFRLPAPEGWEFTGEIRPPVKGEHFLSVFPVQPLWRARGDFETPRRILREIPKPLKPLKLGEVVEIITKKWDGPGVVLEPWSHGLTRLWSCKRQVAGHFDSHEYRRINKEV